MKEIYKYVLALKVYYSLTISLLYNFATTPFWPDLFIFCGIVFDLFCIFTKYAKYDQKYNYIYFFVC